MEQPPLHSSSWSEYAIDSRILGGTSAGICEYPYQVSLETDGSYLCGGSIISEKWLITAAHCFRLVNHSSVVRVRSGSSFWQRDGSLHHASRIIIHECFSVTPYWTSVHDIAVVEIEEPFFNFTSKPCEVRKPIELFGKYEKIEPGMLAVVSGWGLRDVNEQIISENLQKVNLPILSVEVCNAQLKFTGGLSEGQICAGYSAGGRDACYGDSGGPLAIEGRLAGIVAWGRGCGLPQRPGAYTAIPPYRNWIKRKTGV